MEATGNRSKPCGYYGLHRKGPIDPFFFFSLYQSKYLNFLFKAANKCALVPTKNTYQTQNQKVYLLKTSDNHHIGQSFI